MRIRRYLVPALIWAGIAVTLLLNLGRLTTNPTQPVTGDWQTNAGPVLITEFLANNATGILDEDGDPSDWIELYNRSDAPVNLANWSLTDDPDRPDKWVFGDSVLEPGARLLVWASGKNRVLADVDAANVDAANVDGDAPVLHANFRLSSNPGYLALHPPTARRYLDGSVFEYGDQLPDTSFGLELDESGQVVRSDLHFDTPTPGAANALDSAWAQVRATVDADAPAGFYDAPFAVTLALDADSVRAQGVRARDLAIRYTTDGSLPSLDNGHVYTEPVRVATTTVLRAAAVAPGYAPGPALTQSYIFVEHVLEQPDDPTGFPESWGTHDISLGGYTEGAPREAVYGMDPRITTHAEFGPRAREGLTDLPSVSLVMPVTSFDIYDESHVRGVEAERALSVEFLYPDDPARNRQVDAGVRIHGGAGRWSFMPKQSFRLYFRSEYGPSRLNHQVFPDSPETEFDKLILRAGTDRSFAGHPPTPDNPDVDHRLTTYTRDEWARASQIAMSGMGAHGTFVHLYVNGLYWGLYNLVERLDTEFAATHLGGEPEEWFSVTQGGMRAGMPDRFVVLLDLARAGGLADPERYATMLEFIDPIQFSDYVILQWYTGNRDWPENNWTVNVQYPAGRNLFFVWDAEDTWNDGAEVRLGVDAIEGAPFPNVIKLIFLALWENPDFRMLFADRLYAQLHHDGVLAEANAQARWRELNAQIETAIAAEAARWGSVRYAEPITPADWERARGLVLEQMAGNGARLLDLARDAGYYPPVDPPQMSRQGGEFHPDLTLELHAPAGEIYYTLDGTDPRGAGSGAVAESALHYTAPIYLDDVTTVTARTRVETLDGNDGPVWSAANRAQFWRLGQRGDVRITEVMYHPQGGGDFEYVEIMNMGAIPVDLSGAYFEGIDFRFAPYRSIGAGERMVLIRDFPGYRSLYPQAPFHGVFAGRLSNQGEWLALRTRQGELLDGFTYGVDDRWPISPNGSGDSLNRHDFAMDPNQPDAWRASSAVHGSPGVDDESAVLTAVSAQEEGAGESQDTP